MPQSSYPNRAACMSEITSSASSLNHEFPSRIFLFLIDNILNPDNHPPPFPVLPRSQPQTMASTYAPGTLSGVVTSWLPISSAWPSVAACQTIVWNNPEYTQYNDIDDPGYGISVDNALTCLPPIATQWWRSQPNNGVTTLSLGPIVCPSAYFTASTSTQATGSTWIACCPS
jgi:hypothetical protein